MTDVFLKIIDTNFSFLKGKKLLVTVSGGIDSVVLTQLLHQLNYNITIAHCNFSLRGKDADQDEYFVQELAKKLAVPFYVIHFDTKEYAKNNKLSIQEAARNLRYQWFEEIRTKHQLDYILTAHNLNDSLETFLINLSRGTGLKGLTGIPIINNNIVRPLSSFSREDIITFAKENAITWREDKSNAETKYTRNKIRHQVIPILQELNPQLLNSFKQTLIHLQGSEAIIQDKLLDVVEDVREKRKEMGDKNMPTRYLVKNLKELNNRQVYLYELFAPFGFTNSIDFENLLVAQSGKQLFSKTHRLVKDRDYILIERKKDKSQKLEVRSYQEFLIAENDTEFKIRNSKFEITSERSISDFKSSKFTAHFDKKLLKFPLIVRKWQKGDYFYPIGMQGKKKLSKYFKDEKLSLIEKENIWLLLSDNNIIWIIGKRQDERFKITETTTEIIKIKLK